MKTSGNLFKVFLISTGNQFSASFRLLILRAQWSLVVGGGYEKKLGNEFRKRLGLWEDLVSLPLDDPRHPTQEGTPCGLVKSPRP